MKLSHWILTLLIAGFLAASAWADVYVKNKLFEGRVAGTGSGTLVEASVMLEALGVEGYEIEGEQLTVNEQSFALQDGLVSLKALAEAVGAKFLVNAALGTIDVYQDTGKRTAVTEVTSTPDNSGAVKGYTPNSLQKGVWLTDWEAATAEAKRANKPILINFTGSDWCGWCIRLKKEVFETEAFKNWAGQKVVLMEADFPRKKALAPNLAAQNQQLAQRYQISGYPSIIFVDGGGNQLGPRYGYQEGGPEAWIKGAEQCMKKR
ncbi:MAG: thioredoxin family protein [Vulcanimicrobiota bacterium]